MKTLIAEDDHVSARIIKTILSPYGECDVTVDGNEAFEAFEKAWIEGTPYDLVCLDIMMPKSDGQEALKKIREMEKEIGIVGSKEVKIIMITALGDPKTVVESYYRGGTTSYVVKPIDKEELIDKVRAFGLVQ
jgi:two-component system chemotaxis response regulator CheY